MIAPSVTLCDRAQDRNQAYFDFISWHSSTNPRKYVNAFDRSLYNDTSGGQLLRLQASCLAMQQYHSQNVRTSPSMHWLRDSTINAYTVASTHLEPAAPVYKILRRRDSVLAARPYDVILEPGTNSPNSASSATWCCSPIEAWEPMSAAMRRMQVQVRGELPCVMSPVFCIGGFRHVDLRKESTRKSECFEHT
jgi:hypothetical protein